MALGYRARKRLALLVLVVGLPAYIVAAVTILNLFERPPLWVEFAVYVTLGILWALPLRSLFLGIGKPDPDAPGAGAERAGGGPPADPGAAGEEGGPEEHGPEGRGPA